MSELERAASGGIEVIDRPMPTITWHSFDLRTGKRGQQMQVQTLGTIGRTLGEPTDLSGLSVSCWDEEHGVPLPGWNESTLAGRSLMVALNELDQPMWAGFVYRRRSNLGPWVALDLVTLEGYFDRRYVTDHTYSFKSEAFIVTGLLTDDVIPLGVAFTVDASAPTLRDRTYKDDEDKTVLSVLQELMAVEDGPEFTIDLEWTDAGHTQLEMILRLRKHIGSISATRFDHPGPVADLTFVEDYSAENGANDVLAVSSGEGDTRPTSNHLRDTDLIDGGWALFEYRYSPSTSITNVDTLDDHARSTALEMRDGLNELTLEVNLDTGPRLNQDFFLGDDVTVALTCPRFPEQVDADGAHTPGYQKTVRCIGWEIDYDARRLKPKLLEVG